MKKLIVILVLLTAFSSVYAQRNRMHVDQAALLFMDDYDIQFSAAEDTLFEWIVATSKDTALPNLLGLTENWDGYIIVPIDEYNRLEISNDTVYYVKIKDETEWGYYTLSGSHKFTVMKNSDTLALFKNYKALARKKE